MQSVITLKFKRKFFLLYLEPTSFTSTLQVQVSVENDHKPLQSFFKKIKKTLFKAPQRTQRMMLRVQHYELKVNYVRGNQLLIAGTLSRASQSESTLVMVLLLYSGFPIGIYSNAL